MLDLRATIDDHPPLKFSVGISSLATFRPTEAPLDPSIGNGFSCCNKPLSPWGWPCSHRIFPTEKIERNSKRETIQG